MMEKRKYLLVNFGGPRSPAEVKPFLVSLLTDREVVRSKMPLVLHHFFFNFVARKRAKRVRKEYHEMGGSSPIYADTQALCKLLEPHLGPSIEAFHRYLPSTHRSFFGAIKQFQEERVVFPMFAQFCYATTGSCARYFSQNLSADFLQRMKWVRSYATHSAFISLFQSRIRSFLNQKGIEEQSVLLLFSAHGIPKEFVAQGDPYEQECQGSFHHISTLFPNARSVLCYQSQFGKGEWLTPSTHHVSLHIESFMQDRSHVLFVPLSFTSDHIETLVEIEKEYMPLVRQKGYKVYRLEAFNRGLDWVEAIAKICESSELVCTESLIRK